MKIKSLWLASVAAILLAGCDGGSSINGGGGGSGDDGGAPPSLVTDSPERISGVSAEALRGDREPLDPGRYLQLLRDDLNGVSRSQQSELVYLDFHAAYNSKRLTNADLHALANATLELLNQIDVEPTSAGTSSVSVVLDQNGAPVGVRFNPARVHLDKRKGVVDVIVRLSNRNGAANAFPCDVPAIPVLDFLHLASSGGVFNPPGDPGAGAPGTFESVFVDDILREKFVRNYQQLVDVTPGDDPARGCVLGGASDVGGFGDE